MNKCYLVYHNVLRKHIVAVFKSKEKALLMKEQLWRRIGSLYEIEEKEFIW